MTELKISKEYFSPRATFECGQVFRFYRIDGGYFAVSADKACTVTERDGYTIITCEDSDEEYFRNYFDLDTDYKKIYAEAFRFGVSVLSEAVKIGRGLRLLKQDKTECLISFIVSQQNNIPRIKGILSRLCKTLGEKKTFFGREFYAFPSLSRLAAQTEEFYRASGLGYRAKYVSETAKRLETEGFSAVEGKKGNDLKRALTQFTGVGNKVADCVALFAFGETAAFPVDTWIAKLYREDFGGKETDREKINRYFTEKFGPNAGIFQQYLFYYKRGREI